MAQKGKVPTWWKQFIKEYLSNGNNAAAAYQITHPKVSKETAKVNACKLLTDANFNNQLSIARAKLEQKFEMSKEEWFKLHNDIARFDIRDYIEIDEVTGDTSLKKDWKDRPDGHVIQELNLATTTQENGAVVQRVKIARDSKLKALESIGKSLGYLKDMPSQGDVIINFISPYGKKDSSSAD